MQKVGEKLFPIGILVFFALLFVMTFQIAQGSRRMPLLIGLIGIVAALVQVIVEFRTSSAVEAVTSEENDSSPGSDNLVRSAMQTVTEQREVGFFLWLIAFFVLIYLIGSIAAIPVYLFLITRYFFKERLLVSIFLATGSLVVYYVLFLQLLKMVSYDGLLLTWFTNL